MKLFIHRSITIGLIVSSIIISSLLDNKFNALALTPEQIMQKLNQIPVFTIGNSKEILLSDNDNKKIFVTYLNHQDAQQVVENITKENPERQVKVITIPLGKVYQLLKDKQKSESQGPPDLFTFVPGKKQLTSALSILKKEDPTADTFPGIPLFYGMVTVDKKKTFLSINYDKESFTPFYFERESLQKLIETIKKQQPELASSIEVKVTQLEGILSAFEKNDKEQERFAKSVVLVPSEDSAKKLLEILKEDK
ncbi:Tic22 family protein [Cyanobacterium sp. uoEpiScrs1]|uniref:Tic22 family protein n=1 Tax=Cyanobacterium sp. uoEpiScrs1 TaxID=2976343 RepID=UPI00226A9C13|nr:Tic22 family protein [Cyanobacterium sp. uoEpiScrs1]